MVSSVDGRTSVAGKASGIGSRTDRSAMRAIRSRVDAVMVGAGTLRAEKVDLGLDDPEAAQPLAVIVGGAGGMQIEERLVLNNGQEALVVLPQGARSNPTEAGAGAPRVLRGSGQDAGRVDLRSLLGVLRAEHGVRRLLAEGGPSLNRALVDAGLVDEIFLTVAPKLLTGPESSILSGDPEAQTTRGLDLISAYAAEDELFLRYRLKNTD
jgi:2,5-diamino-6-(ribosylamino)-4(3H)-pyrimidinone 5'-phosphate reductase